MLYSLHIENVAIIDKLTIEFSGGFTILTGETGAGKSILVDSIGLLLGSKARREIVGSFDSASRVQGCFSDISAQAREILQQQGFTPDDDGFIWIERRVTAEGRSTARIQNTPVSVSVLQMVAPYLVNIHGQHDNILLLDSEKHIDFLDSYAENEALLTQYQTAYQNVKKARITYEKLQRDLLTREQQIESIKSNLQLFEEVGLYVGLGDDLRTRRQLLQQQQKIQNFLQSTLACVDGEDGGLVTALDTSIHQGMQVSQFSTELAEILHQLEAASVSLQPVATLCKEALEQLQSGDDINQIEDRLYQLEQLLLKFGPNEDSALAECDQMRTRLDELQSADESVENAKVEYMQQLEKLKECALTLSASRSNAAKTLCNEMMEQLGWLDMEGVDFAVDLTQPLNSKGGMTYTAKGMDRVEFLLSANRGQPLRPLSKIASGGELSRIMLSLIDVLSQKTETSALIFDEVDVGVSGKTAEKIGRKLAKVANKRQVICITHLAQIAALAAEHFLIEKIVREGRHITTVRLLSEEQRVQEVARIMSGVEITDTVRCGAKEMLQRREK